MPLILDVQFICIINNIQRSGPLQPLMPTRNALVDGAVSLARHSCVSDALWVPISSIAEFSSIHASSFTSSIHASSLTSSHAKALHFPITRTWTAALCFLPHAISSPGSVRCISDASILIRAFAILLLHVWAYRCKGLLRALRFYADDIILSDRTYVAIKKQPTLCSGLRVETNRILWALVNVILILT